MKVDVLKKDGTKSGETVTLAPQATRRVTFTLTVRDLSFLDAAGHEIVEPGRFQVEIPTGISLMTVAAIILIAIVLSVMVVEREKRTGAGNSSKP